MTDNQTSNKGLMFQRLQRKLHRYLPSFITPLRLNILIGYALVAAIGLIAWDHIESAWRYLAALLAPIGALIGALLALKLGVVIVTLFTLLTSLIKVFSGFLMVVIKPGIIKAIVVPPLMSLLKWLHKKSTRLQHFVDQMYEKLKSALKTIIGWWSTQNPVDKILLFSFLIPVLIIVLVVFIIERATAAFAGKKLAEQVVQRTTKFVIGQFHRIPVIGQVPAYLKTKAQNLTLPEDREDLAQVFEKLRSEIYQKRDDNTDVQER